MSAPMPEGPEIPEIPEVPAFNLDAPLDDAPVVPAETAPTADTAATGSNPAWDTLKEKLPKEFHSQIEPILSDWDKGVQQKFQSHAEELRKYEAWKGVVESGITPQQLQVSHSMAQNLNNDPLTFYNNLAGVLRENGLLKEAAQVQAKVDEELENLEQVNDPRIDQIAQQQQQILDNLGQQQRAQLQAEADARIDAQIQADMAFIEERTGPLPDWAKNEVINRAGLMTQQLGRPVSLREAYTDFQKMRAAMLNTPRPGELAPRVVPGGGGFPANKPNPEALKTYDGRTAAIAEIINRGKS